MRPWDYLVDGSMKTNESRNPFLGMIGQLMRHVGLFYIVFLNQVKRLKLETNFNNLIVKEADASLGPFVIRSYFERRDIGIGGMMGTITSRLLVRYPSETVTSIYATLEPYDYTVNNNSNYHLS